VSFDLDQGVEGQDLNQQTIAKLAFHAGECSNILQRWQLSEHVEASQIGLEEQ
jgi:hypothetical protein